MSISVELLSAGRFLFSFQPLGVFGCGHGLGVSGRPRISRPVLGGGLDKRQGNYQQLVCEGEARGGGKAGKREREPEREREREGKQMGVGSSTPLSTGQEQSGGVRVSVKERYHAYLPEGTNFNAELNEQKVKIVHDHWNFIADEVSYRVASLKAARGLSKAKNPDSNSCVC